MKCTLCFPAIFLLFILSAGAQNNSKRTLKPSDIFRIQTVNTPVVSPDGKWVVYTVNNMDSAKDQSFTHLHMVSWDGRETLQLTRGEGSETSPQWSPDGKFISFLSSREGEKNQVWLLNLKGGEPEKVTDEKGEMSNYGWSPDSKKLVLEMKDSLDTTVYNKRKPYVINRYKFKEDIDGYAYDTRKTHLYIFDIASKTSFALTKGKFNETDPAWSPNGDKIVFVSNQTSDPDRNRNKDVWVIDPREGAVPSRVTTWKGGDESPRWSPDGKWIAYMRTNNEDNSDYYDQEVLCITSVNGGEPKLLSKNLDRPVYVHRWSKDGKTITGLVEDDIETYLASFNLSTGEVSKIAGGKRTFMVAEPRKDGGWAALMAEPQVPGEIYAVQPGEIRKLSHVNDEFLDSLSLARVVKYQSKSKDGTLVSGLLYYPPSGDTTNLPLVFFLHGGPVAQDEYGFDQTCQMIAANGFAVATVNYRGSSGRGLKYSKVISGNWGGLEVMDILGAADHLVGKGVANPKKLGIGGWSYGGMLTDYTIASDKRFAAACSGAGTAAPLSLYGVDMYINQYEYEIGQPWIKGNLGKYLKISYPFLHADRIKTPTLFMGGDKDFNVPLNGGEQMYQALRALDVPTELVVYTGQFHSFTQPSFIMDRYERYWQWFDKYLKQ